MTDLTDIEALNKELESAIINFESYHADMEKYRQFYMHSAFYAPKSGARQDKKELHINLLKVFADKNIHYTCQFPNIKVPTTGASIEQRQAASIREKVLYAVHRKSGTPLLQKKWAKDVTLRSAAISEVRFNIEKRCAEVKRYDPRYVFWQLSNDNSRRVVAFWAVFPITADECQKRYGFRPEKNLISTSSFADQYLSSVDGKDWFIQAIRWDDKTRTAWVGDKFIEEAHNHNMGVIPVDLCLPFDDEEYSATGSFFLHPLVPAQAELNHVIKQRANIIQRMANPVVWGRGIIARQFDDLASRLENQGGGFVGLKQQGELGLLQVNETTMLDNNIVDLINHMMRLSGFSAAAFGESVGANTSGDALGMYFTPTQRLIEFQNVSWVAFYESINAKILRAYDMFAKYGEQFKLDGYAPRGTVIASGETGKYERTAGGFDITFDKSVLGGNYSNVVTFPNVTPKNEVAERAFWRDSAKQGIISRTTAYEEIGLLSPEDELAMLTQEQQEPALNPEGTSKLLQAASQMNQSPALPSPAPAPIEGAPNAG